MSEYIIIKCSSIVWLAAGLMEWLFVFGILKETVPKLITALFRCCAVLNLVIAFGLWNGLEWARLLGAVIVVLQFFAQGWIIYSQRMKAEAWRYVEIALFIFYLWFFNQHSVIALFH